MDNNNNNGKDWIQQIKEASRKKPEKKDVINFMNEKIQIASDNYINYSRVLKNTKNNLEQEKERHDVLGQLKAKYNELININQQKRSLIEKRLQLLLELKDNDGEIKITEGILQETENEKRNTEKEIEINEGKIKETEDEIKKNEKEIEILEIQIEALESTVKKEKETLLRAGIELPDISEQEEQEGDGQEL